MRRRFHALAVGLVLGAAALSFPGVGSTAGAMTERDTQVTTEGPLRVDMPDCLGGGEGTFSAVITTTHQIVDTSDPNTFHIVFRDVVDYTVVPDDPALPTVTGEEIDRGSFNATRNGTTVFTFSTHDTPTSGYEHLGPAFVHDIGHVVVQDSPDGTIVRVEFEKLTVGPFPCGMKG
jgi:hypothetical protein